MGSAAIDRFFGSRVARVGFAVLLFVSSTAASTVRAQELNYQTFLIGTRAMGMGGAFTGVADDPSAAYHNPAGLGLLVGSSASANLSANAFERYVVHGGYGTRLGPQDLEHDALPSLPLFVGFVQKFGDTGREGVRQHGIAGSIERTNLVRRRFAIELLDEDRGVADSLRISHEDQTTWYGVTYGARVDPGFALGAGVWLSVRGVNHTEDQFTASGIIPAGARRTADNLIVRQSVATLEDIGVALRFGMLWQANEHWRFGLMLQPELIPVITNATIFSTLGQTGTGAPPAIEELRFVEQNDLDADTRTPWQLRLGGYYRYDDTLGIAADLGVYSPIGSDVYQIQTFGEPLPDPVTGEVASPGLFMPRDWYANMTFNASVGMEAVIEDVVPIQAGVFTDLSAAPSIDGPSPTYEPAQVHAFGVSLAGGIRTGEFDFEIGATGVFGWGTALGTNPDPLAQASEAYLPRAVERQTIYFYLSGTERVAAQLFREIIGGASAEEARESERETEVDPTNSEIGPQWPDSDDDVPPPPPQTDEDEGGDEDGDEDDGDGDEERGAAQPEPQASVAPNYLRSPWPDLATRNASRSAASGS